MIQIGDTIISLDLIEQYFCCELSHCKGACCIEGDAGAPIEKSELDLLQKILPVIWNDMSPEAQATVNRQGVGYVDVEGETVVSIVNGRDCVFACYDSGGLCRCAIEKTFNEGRIQFRKPISCHLYPVRVVCYKNHQAVNYNRWKICRAAEMEGEKRGILLYRFLREPLIRKFGEEWYEALDLCAREYGNKKHLSHEI